MNHHISGPFWFISCLLLIPTLVMGGHEGHGGHHVPDREILEGTKGSSIPGVSFQVFLRNKTQQGKNGVFDQGQANEALQTVIDTFGLLIQNRLHHHRFDEALTKGVLKKVIIEPRVFNRAGKEFSFLVARTKTKGQVTLLISASALKVKEYLNHPAKLAPVLAREFQWVVSKAATKPKPKKIMAQRDLKNAPVKTNKEISNMSGDDREQVLHALFSTYLKTVDDFNSLDGESYYDVGTTTLLPPMHQDSTTKLYDIRVREALQMIVREAYFGKQTLIAVRSLLNGKIWNVSFVKIKKRDWATRTRVLPKEKAVQVGARGQTIQPAKILVNYHRVADPEDPFYAETNGLPMGALPAPQLAHVIAWEIQSNIIEKSMRGHVAQDEIMAPQ
ncbi:MAG: hypothetical protein GKS05_02170 [Nitrospirales bacterium]|nr:hypothetical protein [Nitrospirales bacterium]